MIDESSAARVLLTKKLASLKAQVAEAITVKYFLNHPDALERFGDRGRQFCTADCMSHIDFLCGALQADAPEAFADYARWTVRMLESRNIPAHTLDEIFLLLDNKLAVVLRSEEAQAVAKFLALGRAACAEHTVAIEPAVEAEADGLHLTQKVFLAAILAGQRQTAVSVAEEALRAGHSHIDIYVGVFTEALRGVGRLWEQNKISIAQEHMATSITQYAIAAIYPKLVPIDAHRGNMVVTGVSGELHQIGANLVADSMEAMGWSVRFLGSNLPHASVVSAIEESSANVLCISTTIVANLPSVGDLVRTVRSKMSDRAPKIVLGGAAYCMAPKFAEELGAGEAFTDLRTAIDRLCA